MKGFRLSVGAVLIALIAGCGPTSATPAQLTVLAASSLSSSLDDLAAAWHTAHPNTALVTSVGATSALRTQIELGSPADVLLGADTANGQALVDEEDAVGPLTVYATNSLAIIVPATNPKGLESAADLAKPGVCVIAAGAQVPINKYAEQLVANLALRPEYGPAFQARYEANICSREDNVGAVVNKISLGEGDAAIVYVTDAAAAGSNVVKVALPTDSNVVATYGGVVVKASSNASGAADFLAWLTQSDAQNVLEAHGFGGAP